MDANTAWAQIPAGVKMALGARQPVGGADSLHFRVGSNRTLDKIVVKLNGLDLYDLEMVRIARGTYDVKTLAERANVDADALGRTILGMVEG